MHTEPVLGLILLFVGGIASGSFAVPMKLNRGWAWENTWFLWTIFALVLFPSVLTIATLPDLSQIYAVTGLGSFLTLAAFGIVWGAAQAFFGLAVDALGVALAFSIVPGMSAALGALIPLFHLHPKQAFHLGGIGTEVGVLFGIFGMCVCAAAGDRRQTRKSVSLPKTRRLYIRGLSLAILSGLGSASANLALTFAEPLMRAVVKSGADPIWASNAVWFPMMLGAAIPNLLYCSYRMSANYTLGRLFAPQFWHYWLNCSLMAVLWFGSISLYGIASMKLGSWGTILGWPLFMSLIVVTATISGWLSGEWVGSEPSAVKLHISGVGFLILSVFVLSVASQLLVTTSRHCPPPSSDIPCKRSLPSDGRAQGLLLIARRFL